MSDKESYYTSLAVDGLEEGERVGLRELGAHDGSFVGDEEVGFTVGSLEVGFADGEDVTGLVVGILLNGAEEGKRVGISKGDTVGRTVGPRDGAEIVGAIDGFLGDQLQPGM
jgi:hypothetical protein